METKVCNKCLLEQYINNFGKLKSSKDGYRYFCKTCRKKIESGYNNELGNLRRKKWREKNKEKIKIHYEHTKNSLLDYQKKYREKNREKVTLRKKKYYEKNKSVIKKKYKVYREKTKIHRNFSEKIKKKNNPIYSLICNMRSRIWKYANGLKISKRNRTFDIVGCQPEFLKEHLQKQFKEGMTWDNRSEWHIDHIIPLSSANNEEELYKLCHYTNLQPLWAEENLKKSNKIV